MRSRKLIDNKDVGRFCIPLYFACIPGVFRLDVGVSASASASVNIRMPPALPICLNCPSYIDRNIRQNNIIIIAFVAFYPNGFVFIWSFFMIFVGVRVDLC